MSPLHFENSYRGRTVLITGDTGFTGSWLTAWLLEIGASVVGIALPPTGPENLYSAANIGQRIVHHDADIRDPQSMRELIAAAKPDFVFHLAAQALVRQSYHDPLTTFATNAMGTANVLEACRHTDSIKAIVVITTDKVYRNNEWVWGYRENDVLGGKDPYSASKAACELIISSYRDSFFSKLVPAMPVGVARAGNIVGGGDWAEDRIVADIVRAIVNKTDLQIRNPSATRPWQHVLAACHGYLLIGASLADRPEISPDAWNIGPDASETRSVADVIDAFSKGWCKPAITYKPSPLAEAGALTIDSERARRVLGWQPAWRFDEVLERTAHWYRSYYDTKSPAMDLCLDDIAAYRTALKKAEALCPTA